MRTRGANVMDLMLKSNGTFTADLKKTVEILRGVWAQDNAVRIQFEVIEPPFYTIGAGFLMGEKISFASAGRFRSRS